MSKLTIKRAGTPDETKQFVDKGEIELFRFDKGTIAKGRLQPGFRWSVHEKPLIGTESCEKSHVGFCVSGRLHVRMDDGEEGEVGPGDTFWVEAGHDSDVVGDEDFVFFEFATGGEYARLDTKREAGSEEDEKGTYLQEEPTPPPAH